MSEILSLNKPDNFRLEIERNPKTRFLEALIQVTDSGRRYSIKLVRPNDIDILTELFDAESIWAVKSTDAQLEYGKYDFFIMNETTYDTAVDDIVIEVSDEKTT